MEERSITSLNLLSPVEALTRFNPEQNIQVPTEKDVAEYNVRYGYRISGYGFLVEKNMLSEVIENANIYPLPLTGKIVKGVVNQRGNMIPVFDLGKILSGKDKNSDSKNTVLLLGSQGNEIGLVIDELPRAIHQTENSETIPELPEMFEEYVHSGVETAGQDWIEFACHKFMSAFAEQKIQFI